MPIFLVGFSHLKLCLKGQMKLNLQPTLLQTQSSNSEYTVSVCVCNVCNVCIPPSRVPAGAECRLIRCNAVRNALGGDLGPSVARQ